MLAYTSVFTDSAGIFDQERFVSTVTHQLRSDGYCILRQALPESLADLMYQQLLDENSENFKRAGVGRSHDKVLDQSVRRDSIKWLDYSTDAGKSWLEWMGNLKTSINRELLLGLFSFESHYACYEKGAFYKKHVDAFPGDANRILSVVTYLNPDWEVADGGELILYDGDSEGVLHSVLPEYGTMVFFLSEEFPHEVCAANKTRYSIAGWYRLNSSINGVIDPPQ